MQQQVVACRRLLDLRPPALDANYTRAQAADAETLARLAVALVVVVVDEKE